ncbi:MAG: hypothetical protein IH948_06040, partial [Bacteroidetes bacterium]|nr:hypothetical protein [Bacteroidota bacterium]
MMDEIKLKKAFQKIKEDMDLLWENIDFFKLELFNINEELVKIIEKLDNKEEKNLKKFQTHYGDFPTYAEPFQT